MQDFTLVIPTYNRPKLLEALLTYLSAQPQRCHVLVLDSSQPQPRAANRKIVELAELKLDYAEFPSEMHPFDKFREGVHKVTTEFCALCADERRPVKAAKACSNSPENPIVGKQTLDSHDGIDRIWKMLEDIIKDDGIERAIAKQVLAGRLQDQERSRCCAPQHRRGQARCPARSSRDARRFEKPPFFAPGLKQAPILKGLVTTETIEQRFEIPAA
jgi:hypothetical protein